MKLNPNCSEWVTKLVIDTSELSDKEKVDLAKLIFDMNYLPYTKYNYMEVEELTEEELEEIVDNIPFRDKFDWKMERGYG